MSRYGRSNFQRAQSKVWWGSYPDRDEYGFVAIAPTTINNSSKTTPNKSKLTPPEITTTSWSYRRGSPGSFKSHDSGFSDSDHQSPPTANSSLSNTPSPDNSSLEKHTPKRSSFNDRSRSSSASSSGPGTPPTVIRKKGSSEIASGLCRRISFSAPSSPIYERIETSSLIYQIDSLNYANTSPASSKHDISLDSSLEVHQTSPSEKISRSLKRGKVIRRSTNRKERTLLRCVSQTSIGSTNDFYQVSSLDTSVEDQPRVPSISTVSSAQHDEPSIMMQTAIPQTPNRIRKEQSYNNETVHFGTENLENTNLEQTRHILPTYAELFPSQTSTPKSSSEKKPISSSLKFEESILELAPTLSWDNFTYCEYSNPLLNGHTPCVQFWLDETRRSYCHEVLATLQTKSIAQHAKISPELTTTSAGKMIRSLQIKAAALQNEFEYFEKLLEDTDDDDALIKEVPGVALRLHSKIIELLQKLSVPQIFNNTDAIQFSNNVAYISGMSYDLIKITSVNDLSVLQPLGILDDALLIKRYVLMTLRMVYKRLVQIIVDRILDKQYDFIMRSNLSLLALLSNMDFTGFSSLTDAFSAAHVIQVLLSICMDSTHSSIRVLALRALTTICCSREAISEFEMYGGTNIIVQVLCEEGKPARHDKEIREALSVFTQVTADWHGTDHRLKGLNKSVEILVSRLTELATNTDCCQTLLLSVAALKNLVHMETNAIYSLMSNETVLRLKKAFEARGPKASVFLIEQLVCILVHMANNKRCHQHLTNKPILGFLAELYHRLSASETNITAAESASQRRSIKQIIHIFSRLIHHTAAHKEDLEQSVGALFTHLHDRVSQDEAMLNASTRIAFRELSAAFGQIQLNVNASKLNDTKSKPVRADNFETQPSDGSAKKLLESYV